MSTSLGSLVGGAGPALTDPANLEANRRGQITAAQKRALNPALHQGGAMLLALGRILRLGVLAAMPVYFLIWFNGPAWAPWLVGGGVASAMLLALGVQALAAARQWAAINQDVAAGSLSQGPGRLVYGRGGYQAEVGGRRLTLPSSHGLSVGVHYHFFYLPTSGMVIAAEERGMMPPGQASDNLAQSLAAANGFKTGALERNRAGRLAPEQAGAFVPRFFQAGIALLIAAFGAVIALAPQLLFGSGFRLPTAAFGGLRLLVVLVPGLLALYWGGTALADVLLGRVQMVEGDGIKHKRVSSSRSGSSYSTSVTYYYQVGGKRFKVKSSAWNALVEGVPYRAYYTPLTGTLVNLEPTAAPTITL